MAHALSGGELSIIRENDQASELYLAIQNPTEVWAANVSLPTATGSWDNNEVWGVPYGNVLFGAGNETSALLLNGMTMYVGSSGSSVGSYDVGMVRVRQHPLVTGTFITQWGITGSYVPIGETSSIEWGDGMVITIVDEFQLWQRQKRLVDDSGNTVRWFDETTAFDLYMDYDIIYNNQNVERSPVPILGSHAIGWIPAVGGSVNVEFDASDSYVVGDAGATISYGWQAIGHIANTDATASSIILTYDTPGTYRVTCNITNDDNGRQFAGHRYVFIYDDNNLPSKDFVLDECSGNWDVGGWSFKVTMYDEADLDTVRDKALCVLFARDYYGDTEQYVGPLTDREDIIAVGWIDGESINWNPSRGLVEFEVQGPQWWLGRINSWPSWAQDDQYELFDEEENQIEPFAWNLFTDMTIDIVMHQFLHWRSTITMVADVYLTGDTRQIPDMNVSENNLWDQISNIVDDTIQAHPCCDRYGRLFVEIEPQVVLLADRGAIPTVMSITEEDWRSRITIERRTVNEVSTLNFSGLWYIDGVWQNECYEGGGSAFSQHGGRALLDRLLLYVTESDNIEWCGLALAWMNNKYPIISMPLSSNNRAIDICPHQYIELSIDELDTERGIVWESVKLITRNASYSHNAGRLLVDLSCERLITDASLSYNVSCPLEPDNDPSQPEDEIPQPPPWPDEPVGGDDPARLTRNSFKSGGLFRGIDDPKMGKTFANLSFPTKGFKLLETDGTHDVDGGVVSSNNYVYYISNEGGDRRIYRKAYRNINFGQNSVSYSIDEGQTQFYLNISLLDEDTVAYVSQDTGANLVYLKTLTFSTGVITTLLTHPIQVIVGSDITNYFPVTFQSVITIEGNDGKLYITFPMLEYFVPDVGQDGSTYIRHLIYNYTDGVEYSPIDLDIEPDQDFGELDSGSIVLLEAPAIVHSEVVYVIRISDNVKTPPDYMTSVAIHCINVETQVGRRTNRQSVNINVSFHQYRVVLGRMLRRVYFVNDEHESGGGGVLGTYNVIEYDLASNTQTSIADNPNPAGGSDLQYLIQDKEYAYMITNLWAEQPQWSQIRDGFFLPMTPGLQPLSYYPDGKYEKDDRNPSFALSQDNKIVVDNFGPRYNTDNIIDIDGGAPFSIQSNAYIYLQGNILIMQSADKFWVIF